MIVSINPATGAELARFELHSAAEVDAALFGAVKAQAQWRRVLVGERVELLRAMARVLRAGKDRYAAPFTNEIGKPLPESEGEIELGVYGVREFVNVKTLWIVPAAAPATVQKAE